MKTILLTVRLSILLLFGCFSNQLIGQASSNEGQVLDFELESLQTPNLKGSQTTKALVTISPSGRNTAFLTRTSSGLEIVENSNTNEIKKKQLWWVVQDFKHQAFALVSVENGTDWVYLQETNGGFSVILATNDRLEADYIDDNYFFEFVMPYSTQEEKHYLIQSAAVTNNYIKSNTNTLGLESLNTEASAPFIFEFKTFSSFENQYLAIPTYSSSAHTIETINVSNSDDKLTRITTNGLLEPIEDNTAVIGSGNISTLFEGGSKDMFKVTFNDKAAAKLGLLDYNVSVYSKEALQSPGSRSLISGIEKRDNGLIYLFNRGKEITTEFIANTPITFGHENGILFAKQGNKQYTLTGVPTPIILNNDGGNFNRLLAIVRRGSIDMAYKPKAILISKNNFGTINAPSEHTTDPQFSFAPSGRPANTFDWRQEYYSMAYNAAGVRTAINVKSPFYSNKSNLRPISSKFSVDGAYQGGEDFSSIDGWELVQMDFGYDKFGNQKSELRGEPYFILYNRFTGTLRVFLYVYNGSIATSLKVTIADKETPTFSAGNYYNARLWSSYLQGKALDNPTLGSPEYSKYIKLSASQGSKFYYVDFTLNYDPCTCFFESNLQVKVDRITQGNLEIVGKTLGGSIPAGAAGYKDWMKKSGSFLTGVLNTPFGKQTQSLGDISLTSLNEWKNTPWSNETKFTIPGRKVKDWEREALRLQYGGTIGMATGDFVSAAGKAMKAAGEAYDALPFVGKAGKAVGEAIDAAGTAVKGAGRAATAAAVKVRLDNLEDEPDKVIPLQFPDPQPSLVFAELAAKGKVTFKTNIFEDVVITTPGSKNAERAPIQARNRTKGAFPYYNEPLGVFNLVYTPKVAVAIVKNEQDRFGAHLRLKEKPYVTTNMDKVQGNEFGFFLANYVVTTYNKQGYSVNSVRSTPFLIDNNLPVERQIPVTLDITDLLDEVALKQNIGNSNVSANSFRNWIGITLEIDYMGLSGVAESGKQNAELVRQSYDAITEFSYNEVTTDIPGLNQAAQSKANEIFASSYAGADNSTWGDNYIITKNTPSFDTNMKRFCKNTMPQPQQLSSRKSVTKEDSVKQGGTVLENQEVVAAENQEAAAIKNTQESEESGVFAYPNPSASNFKIQYTTLDKGAINFTILDVNGRVILSAKDTSLNKGERKEAHINLQTLNEGLYLLKIKFSNGKSHEIKLIKKD